MRYGIGLAELDPSQGNVIEFNVRAPGKVLHGYAQVRQRSVLLAREEGQNVVVMPTLVIESDPLGPFIRKRFVCFVPGLAVDTSEPPFCGEELEYVATIVNPFDQRPMIIYEAPVPIEAIPTVDDRPGPVSGEIAASP